MINPISEHSDLTQKNTTTVNRLPWLYYLTNLVWSCFCSLKSWRTFDFSRLLRCPVTHAYVEFLDYADLAQRSPRTSRSQRRNLTKVVFFVVELQGSENPICPQEGSILYNIHSPTWKLCFFCKLVGVWWCIYRGIVPSNIFTWHFCQRFVGVYGMIYS